MPHPDRVVVRVTTEGLVGRTEQGKDVPVGVVRNGEIVLLLRTWEDERENCEHCGGLLCIGDGGDDDDRCGRCNKSHRECNGCDRNDAETCIHCDSDWCEDCWTKGMHAEGCPHVRRETILAEDDAAPIVHNAYLYEDAEDPVPLCGAQSTSMSIVAKRINCPECLVRAAELTVHGRMSPK